MSKCMLTTLVSAVLTAMPAMSADVQYWPNGETSSAPYGWTNAANWAEKVKTPTSSLNRTPTSADAVYLAANELVSDPLEIHTGNVVTVSSVYLGVGDSDGTTPNAIYGNGQGARLRISGGSLTTTADFVVGKRNYEWGVLDLLGGAVSVGRNFLVGDGNTYAEPPSVITVAPLATLDVTGLMHIGVRTQRGLSVVTNAGAVTVGSLTVGPDNSSYVSHGAFCNAPGGRLTVAGSVKIPGSGKSANSSSGEMRLLEGSSFTFGGSSFTIGGAPGTGLLHSETSTDLSSANTFKVGGSSTASTGTLYLAKSAWLKIRELEIVRGQIEMEGNSVIDVETVNSSTSLADAYIQLRENAAITNVNNVLLGPVYSSRSQCRGHLLMDGDSEIVFAPGGSERRFFGGSQSNGWMDVTLSGRSAVRGVKLFAPGAGVLSGSGGNITLHARGADLTFAGGTVSFGVSSENGTFQLGASGSTTTMRPVVHAHGYGAITRDDIADLSNYKVNMSMPCPVWSITADGGGVMRDFDFRAVNNANDAANYGNKSGTNGWFAANGGRLLYPRACPLAYTSSNPVRGIGESPDMGKTGVPTLLNSATVKLPSAFESSYLYAALYAADRGDVPAGIPVGDGAVIAVWRLGLAEDWKADDPATPKAFCDLPFTFCYDVRAIPNSASIEKVSLWQHDGETWRRIASVFPETDALTGEKTWASTISATLSSNSQTWNGGFLAIGAQTKSGMAIIFR